MYCRLFTVNEHLVVIRVDDPSAYGTDTKRLLSEYAQKRGLVEAEVSHLPIAIFATFFDAAIPVPREFREIADVSIRELIHL